MTERIWPGAPPTTRQNTLYIDAVEALLPAAKLQFARMKACALIITSKDFSNPAPAQDVETAQVALVADTGGFIGNIQRLRLVVPRLRGDADLRITKKAFEASVKSYEPARHHLEHLDTAIPGIADTGHGVFGGIAWWHFDGAEARGCLYVPGSLAVAEGVGQLVVPGGFDDDVDHFRATIAGEVYDLSAAYRALLGLEARLREWASRQFHDGWPAYEGTP